MSARVWFGPAPMLWGERVTFALPFRYEIERLYGDDMGDWLITSQTELDDICYPRPGVTGRTVALLRWWHGVLALRRR